MFSTTPRAFTHRPLTRSLAPICALAMLTTLHISNTPAAYAQENTAPAYIALTDDNPQDDDLNAEIPDEGDYTCLTPGRHEITLTQSNAYPQVYLRDYTDEEPQDRENFSVVIPIPDTLKQTVTANDTAAGFNVIADENTPVWTLPHNENPAYPWIGITTAQWDYTTTTTQGVNFSLSSLTGPGEMKMWSYTTKEGIQPHLDSTQPERPLSFPTPSTTHLNTTFTQPGFYEVDYAFTAQPTNPAHKKIKAAYLVYYAVGNDMVTTVCGEEFTTTTTAEENTTEENSAEDNTTETTNNSPKENTPTPQPPTNINDTDTTNTQENDTEEDVEANTTDENINVEQNAPKDTKTQENPAQNERQHTNTPTPSAADTAQSAPSASTPSNTLIPATENSAHERPRRQHHTTSTPPTSQIPETCEAVIITRESEEHEANKVRQAQAQDGHARTTIHINVGENATGNATNGHFDLGPIINNGTIYARVKDDRTQPAQWLDPTELTFALGNAAALPAPQALNFIAPQGKKIWMIQQSQQKNVPWIGMNSQHPSILEHTTGEVTFTLEAVRGPGKVAIFESGTFGAGVGDILLNEVGSSYTIGANTHAHHNWVFTEPGHYDLTLTMSVQGSDTTIKGSQSIPGGFTLTGENGPNGRPMIQEIVGRTPSGKECNLSDDSLARNGLASTGTSAQTLMILSIALATLATLFIAQRKSHA